jgi:hypothetical protein
MYRNKSFREYLTAEDLFQEACMNYIKLKHPDWMVMHVPNEGKRSSFERMKASVLGMTAGVSDILVFEDIGPYKGICMELKVYPNKCTPRQVEFMVSMSERGYASMVIYNRLDEFIKAVDAVKSNSVDPYTISLFKDGNYKSYKIDMAMDCLTPKSRVRV